MDKRPINFSFKYLVTKFRHAKKESIDPNALWHGLIWGTFLALLSVSGFAYFTYDWAITAPAPLPHQVKRDTFSLADLERIIALYRQKEINFESLQRTAPTAPSYQGSEGTMRASSTPPQEDPGDTFVAPQLGN